MFKQTLAPCILWNNLEISCTNKAPDLLSSSPAVFLAWLIGPCLKFLPLKLFFGLHCLNEHYFHIYYGKTFIHNISCINTKLLFFSQEASRINIPTVINNMVEEKRSFQLRTTAYILDEKNMQLQSLPISKMINQKLKNMKEKTKILIRLWKKPRMLISPKNLFHSGTTMILTQLMIEASSITKQNKER